MLLNQILIISIFSNQSISIKILIQILILINTRCSGKFLSPQPDIPDKASLRYDPYHPKPPKPGKAKGKDGKGSGPSDAGQPCPKDARSRRAMANPFVDSSIVESVGTKSKLESAALEGCTFAGNLVAIERSQRTSVRIQTDYRIADKFHFLQCLRLQAQQILLRRIIEFAIPYHNHLSHFFADIPSRFHEPVPAKPKSPTSQNYITKKLFQKVWVATPSKKTFFSKSFAIYILYP